jgi:hypothetical protein
MITVGLLSLCLVAATGVSLFLLTRVWTLEVAFIRVSWIPLAALVFEGVFFANLTTALSYFAVAIVVLTCILSIFLTLIGITLVASARQRHEHHAGLFRATLLASFPGVLLTGFILYAFLAHTLRSGG